MAKACCSLSEPVKMEKTPQPTLPTLISAQWGGYDAQMMMSQKGKRRPLDGAHHLPEVIQRSVFPDGIKQTQRGA
ncbi:MAG: hypothetical protein COA78_00905 [Blastopirellula sp.]|nr:MAG: hypothetical protein COA78_00905 [Blastopirellula sp.]